MNQPSFVCLSLTPNLRCVGFTLVQSETLIIPPTIEVIISLVFIYSCSGPGRRPQILLAADSILYFTWALLDMLSHVVPAARTSLSIFKVFYFLLGAVSFTPILVYSFYLYRLSFRHFIPTLPRKLQPYLEISLPILSVIAVTLNEVSSFVGTHLGTSSSRSPIVMFSDNSGFLWHSLSHCSLTIFIILQFLFFLLAFSRLSRAFLDQRRIELTHSDECHYLHGIAWIAIGIITGVIETMAGFAQVSFGLVLARRTLRLISRATLMFGLLKGLDVAENFENLTDELRGISRINKHISRMLGINLEQTHTFRRMTQSYSEDFRADEYSSAEKQPREQRVTVHYEKGQAPFLQIRFSTIEFPPQAILADVVQQRRLSGLNTGRANGGCGTRQHRKNISDEMVTTRSPMLQAPKVKSAPATCDDAAPDWFWPPVKSHTRQGSGETIPDNLSIVRDLERRFPNLPPRVTGKYRGSILGQNYEEDPFPVVGVSRQSSIRRDPENEDCGAVTLRSSDSIKRKPAPPLLENINVAYISDLRKRPTSSWGGLTQNTVNYPAVSPVTPNGPWEGYTINNPDPTPAGEPSTPRPRRTTARDLIKRASRAMSDASIRSAEWLASARSQSARPALTAADIEMYRKGNLGPGLGEASLSRDHLPKASRKSADAARVHS